MARYEPPEWGLAGRNAFGISLEVIKGGLVVETLALPLPGTENKSKGAGGGESCVVAGRMEPLCDLVLQHPSISRVHAALQFDEHGALFLCDLCSTHGCFVNKKRVPPKEFVRLHIGDVVVFGESTRLYAVCGPPELLPAEYESLNLSKLREKLERKRAVRAKQQEIEKKKLESGASWGFGEDAEEEEEEEEEEGSSDDKEQLPDYLRNLKEDDQPYQSRVSKSELNEKDAKLFQQLQTRIRKMENLKQERSRILAKEHQLDGLSEGQQRTLDRNEQRIEALMKEIDVLEDRIHAKNEQRSQTSAASAGGNRRTKRNVNEELYGYASDEDDFYDRTKANQRKLAARKQQITGSTASAATASQQIKTSRSTKGEVLTVDSIQENIARLESELVEVQTQVKKGLAGQATHTESKQEEDSLDSFMANTTRQLHVNEANAAKKRLTELETELQRQRQLLAVAMPALASLPLQKATSELKKKEADTALSVGDAKPAEKAQEAPLASANYVKPREAAGAVAQRKMEPEPAHSSSRTPASERNASTLADEEQKVAAAVCGPPLKEVEVSHRAPKRSESQPSSKKRRVMGPTLGPLPLKKPSSADSKKAQGDDGDTLEGGDQVWVPPANQTGDGRTKLNEKFGY